MGHEAVLSGIIAVCATIVGGWSAIKRKRVAWIFMTVLAVWGWGLMVGFLIYTS